MLVFGWLVFGVSFLCLEAGVLSLGAQSGQYLSPIGALKFDLTQGQPIPFSQWPWGDVSIGDVLARGIKGLV